MTCVARQRKWLGTEPVSGPWPHIRVSTRVVVEKSAANRPHLQSAASSSFIAAGTRPRHIRNTTPDSAIVGRTRVLIITPMPASGAPLKMNLRPSAREIRGIQQTSERLIGFLEWGADFILGLARGRTVLRTYRTKLDIDDIVPNEPRLSTAGWSSSAGFGTYQWGPHESIGWLVPGEHPAGISWPCGRHGGHAACLTKLRDCGFFPTCSRQMRALFRDARVG